MRMIVSRIEIIAESWFPGPGGSHLAATLLGSASNWYPEKGALRFSRAKESTSLPAPFRSLESLAGVIILKEDVSPATLDLERTPFVPGSRSSAVGAAPDIQVHVYHASVVEASVKDSFPS